MSAASELIHRLPAALDASAAGDADCSIQFNLSTIAHIQIRSQHCEVADGPAASPDVTVTMDDEDFIALMTGELNGMTAFMTGKLSIDGDLLLAQRVTQFFDARKLR